MSGQNIVISVLADTQKFSAGMKKAGDELGGLGKVLGGIGKGFGLALGAMGAAVAAIGLTGFISDAVAASDATDKFKQTLAFAGIKPKGIEALAKSTKAYADQTVYNLGDIQNVTAQLAANAVPNYDKLAQAAGNLNAVAGGNADTFKSVGMVLTQTAGAGKLTTENWNQLADAIPGASGILQEAMLKNGAYTGNFRDAMSKGQITAAEFNTALMQIGMSDVAKEAATSTQTFEGAWGNLQATITGGLADILSAIKPFATEFMTNTAGVVGPALEGVKGFIQNSVLPALKGFGEWFTNEGLPALQGFGDWINTNILPRLQGLADWFTQTGTPAINDFGNFFNNTLLPAVQDLGNFVANDVLPALDGFGQWLQDNKDILLAVGVGILAAAAAFAIWNGSLTAYAVVQNIANAAQAAWNVISKANPIMLIVMAVMALAAGLIYFFTQTETGQKMWKTFTDFLEVAWSKIVTLFNKTLADVKKWFSDAANNVEGTWEGVSKFFSELPGKIQKFFADAANLLVSRGKEILDGLKRGAENTWGSVANFFKSIPGKVQGALSGADTWLLDTGKNIIQGLWNGISSKVDWVVGMVKGLGSRVIDAAKSIFGIASPSKVFAEIGGYLSEGLAKGITNEADLAAKAASSLGDLTTGAFDASFDSTLTAPRGGNVYVFNGIEVTNGRIEDALAVLADEITHYAGVGV